MDRDVVQIETPEHVVFEYELAGLGSRLIAAILDVLVIGVILLGLFLGVVVVAGGLDAVAPWAMALGAVAAFVTFWGYPILFEVYWKGQTPGKRVLRLRVIREGGYALTPQAVIVRNLLRIVDFLPGGYFLGILTMMLNRRYKRLGDYVAGTLVIRESSAAQPPTRWETAVPAGQEERIAELRRQGVHRLDASQLQLIRDFMRRRATLRPEARLRLAQQLAASVCETLGLEPQRGETFLQCVLAAVQQGEEKPTA